ncbi:MAG: AMP-binding protein, partial [Chloroflexi bacterium]|nr:AMP-binding protein [Chloroflexota bacterium]
MATYQTTKKPPLSRMKARPNLTGYQKLRNSFQFTDVYSELDWLPDGGLNKAHECIDRHANGPLAGKRAMVWEGKNGEQERYTFADMKRETNRFANVLRGLGVQRGDRVFTFLDRVPEHYFAVFGILKAGAIAGPLFSAFGPDPVRDRLLDSGAKVLVTSPELRGRIAHIFKDLPELKHIVIVNKLGRDKTPIAATDLRYEELMARASPDFKVDNTSMYDYSIMHYTSGTTGKPKGAV